MSSVPDKLGVDLEVLGFLGWWEASLGLAIIAIIAITAIISIVLLIITAVIITLITKATMKFMIITSSNFLRGARGGSCEILQKTTQPYADPESGPVTSGCVILAEPSTPHQP